MVRRSAQVIHTRGVFDPGGALSPSPAAPESAMRGIVGRIVKVVVMKVVDFVAGEAVEFLGKKLEEKLWRDAGRRGVGAGGPAGGGGVRSAAEPARAARGGRGLLCIHGTFSNTVSAFKHLLRTDAERPPRALRDRIYGFEHFTLSKSPETTCGRC